MDPGDPQEDEALVEHTTNSPGRSEEGVGGPSARADTGRGRSALAIAAFAMAVAGQFYFQHLRSIVDGFVFFAVAIVLLIFLVQSHNGQHDQAEQERSWLHRLLLQAAGTPLRVLLLALSLVSGYAVFRLLRAAAGDQSYWGIYAVWASGSLTYAAAFATIPHWCLREWWRRHRWELFLVLGLTAVALFVRLTRLGEVPNVVSGDEGRVGLLGLAAVNGEIKNMFATLFGHSTLYLFVIGYFMKLVGVDPTGLRITSALAGAVTVPALYVLARHMFGIRVAAIAAALMAISHFHVHFSRVIVAGGIQDALFATVTFYLLLTGLERRSTMRLVLGGLTIGLHLYIYMGARLVIALLPVYLLALLVTNPRLVKENLRGLAALAGMLVIVGVPMIVWATTHTPEFMARWNQIGIIPSGWLEREAIKLGKTQQWILGDVLLKAFLSVNYYPAIAFYWSKLPMLDFLSGALYMLGLGLSFFKALDRRYLLLLGWFFSGVVIGGALVVEAATSAYRILIIFPAVCMLVALGFDCLLRLGIPSSSLGKLLGLVLSLALVGVLAFTNLRAYFLDFAPSCRYEDWGTRFSSFMGEELGKVGKEYRAFLFGYPDIVYGVHPNVDFFSGKNPVTDIKEPLRSSQDFDPPGGRMIFFFTPKRLDELEVLRQVVPGGAFRQIDDCGQLMIAIYEAPAP